MRTKTLLIAAAALAATVITSQAQVYSANIVGYASQKFGAGSYTIISNPLSNDTNGAPEIFNSFSPSGGETLYLWAGTGYHVYGFQGAGAGTNAFPAAPSDWTDASYPPTHNIPGEVYDSGDDVYWTPAPALPPGRGGFLFNPNGNETNVYTGTAVQTNSVTIPGGAYTMLSSAIPVSGDITNSAINLTANFSPSGGETLYIWAGTGYHVYGYQGAGAGQGAFAGAPSDWTDASYPPTHNIPGEVYDSGDDVYWTPSPQLSVGQGFFFFNPNGPEVWNQGLPAN